MNANCEASNCTFNSVWHCGGGADQDKLYLASAFFYTAADENIVDSNAGSIEITLQILGPLPSQPVLSIPQRRQEPKYPEVWTSNLPFICYDLAYQYTLLTDGSGLNDEKRVTLVDKVNYGDFKVEATCPLGGAIKIASRMSSPKMEVINMYRFWSHVYAL